MSWVRESLEVFRYRIAETSVLRRLWFLPVPAFVSSWVLAGDLRVERSRSYDALDFVLYALSDTRMVLLTFCAGLLLITGDAIDRSSRTGATSYLLIRCKRRASWWLGEFLANGVISAVFGAGLLVICWLVGLIRLGTTESEVGARWSFEPNVEALPATFGQARWEVAVQALLLVWLAGLCLSVALLALSIALPRRMVAVLFATSWLLVAFVSFPVTTAGPWIPDPLRWWSWVFYVPGIKTAGGTMTAMPSLWPVMCCGVFLSLAFGIGVKAAHHFESRGQ
jgi:hypothetical protein